MAEEMLKAIDVKCQKLKYDKSSKALITNALGNKKYEVLINNSTYTATCLSDDILSVNQIVYVIAPQGNYSDLYIVSTSTGSSNINNNVIEIIQKNGVPLSVSNKTVNIDVPTKTSDLNNDSNFLNQDDLNSVSVNSASKLSTPRKINNVLFDGTQDITIEDNTKAPLNSPVLTGTPTAPTPPSGNNTTQIATTAFVQDALSGGGYGDMLKSVYDTDNDGIVDKSKVADNVAWEGVTGRPSTFAPSTHTHSKSQITDFPTSLPADGGNADTVGGLSVHTGVNNEANKIMRTDSNGYANFGWMQTTSGQLGGKPAGVWVKSGNWLYYQTTDDFILNCGIATKAEVGDMATALSIISGVDK